MSKLVTYLEKVKTSMSSTVSSREMISDDLFQEGLEVMPAFFKEDDLTVFENIYSKYMQEISSFTSILAAKLSSSPENKDYYPFLMTGLQSKKDDMASQQVAQIMGELASTMVNNKLKKDQQKAVEKLFADNLLLPMLSRLEKGKPSVIEDAILKAAMKLAENGLFVSDIKTGLMNFYRVPIARSQMTKIHKDTQNFVDKTLQQKLIAGLTDPDSSIYKKSHERIKRVVLDEMKRVSTQNSPFFAKNLYEDLMNITLKDEPKGGAFVGFMRRFFAKPTAKNMSVEKANAYDVMRRFIEENPTHPILLMKDGALDRLHNGIYMQVGHPLRRSVGVVLAPYIKKKNPWGRRHASFRVYNNVLGPKSPVVRLINHMDDFGKVMGISSGSHKEKQFSLVKNNRER